MPDSPTVCLHSVSTESAHATQSKSIRYVLLFVTRGCGERGGGVESGEWGCIYGEWGVGGASWQQQGPSVCVCESVESVRVSGVGWGLTGEVESGE